jgi:inosine/xanthosine triphosphate pyrophosphatase family protein
MSTRIIYVTSNEFKKQENEIFRKRDTIAGSLISDIVDFEIREIPVPELLEIKIEAMVQAEATAAYHNVRVPCVVEHAGLVFKDLRDASYPGGLTKPMWNSLKDRFIEETNSAGRAAIARAVVAYCDGISVHTFVGETEGRIADRPRGSRDFYWDTVFVPDDAATHGLTYAEIVEHPDFGLEYKVLKLSQSTKAMRRFVEYLHINPLPSFWHRPA